ncbi:MAG: CHAP domain-containing protein, partial [Leptolyngbyaceae bacterium]|nr:CHAP domain-containing protein [Leptolyngbyaceae bacterium]
MPRSIGPLILAEAKTHLGKQENPLGSNKGAEIVPFKKATWLDPHAAWPWCQAFANYVWEQVTGKKHPYPTASVYQFWTYAGTNQPYFQRFRRGTQGPIKGDYLIIGDGSTFDHISIVDEVKDSYIVGLGGNQGDRVQRSHYHWSRVYGFVRPLDVGNQLPPRKPKPPVYEVVVGEGEDAKVVATG